jgi:NADPH2:quinone reductase
VRYVGVDAPGGPDALRVAETDTPQIGPGDVLIAVDAAGVSRADVMQREGNYPPPSGASPILGLEVAGSVVAVGRRVSRWKTGDVVCALVNGGGYAEYAAAPSGQVLPTPEGWSPIEAATLPENAFTVYDNLFTRARLRAGETVLVHGGTSGIGTTAIMFARARGATVVATAGTPKKCGACLEFGASHAIDYRTSDFVAEVERITRGRGVDVIVGIACAGRTNRMHRGSTWPQRRARFGPSLRQAGNDSRLDPARAKRSPEGCDRTRTRAQDLAATPRSREYPADRRFGLPVRESRRGASPHGIERPHR